MARREITITIEAPGRDLGKRFHITEMAARPAHAWATQAIFAVMNAGVDIGDFEGAGLAGLAAVGIGALGKVPYEVADPLLQRLFECVQFMPAPDKPTKRPLFDEDIEEPATLFRLQKEVVMLHIEPFIGGATSTTA